MHRSFTVPVLLVATVLITAGCGGDDPPLTAPTPVDPVAEIIEGTLAPFSVRNHQFEVQAQGSVSANLTAINPPTTIVGIDLGTWTGTSCQVNVSRDRVEQGQAVTGAATGAGRLCVRIYDVEPAGLPATISYSLTVTHF